jgi:hypothetical protein
MGIYDQSEQAIEIEETGVPPAAYTMVFSNLAGIRFWGPPILVVLLLGIWMTFGYVLIQVLGIWKDRARSASA